MNNNMLAFFLTIMAGLSTMVGIFPIFISIKNENRFIGVSLSFAAGVMLCVSITDLIPESIMMLEKYMSGVFTCLYSFVFIFLGIISSFFIDRVVSRDRGSNSLYKVGIISMIAIILHNIPEGIVTFISTTRNISLGISLAIAIALHNIPEGISIGIPIYYSTKSKIRAIGYTFLSAMSEPFGAVLTYFFLVPFINNLILGFLFSFVAGIMIQISMLELLSTSYQYGASRIIHIFFVMGVVFMLFKFLV